MYNSEEMKQKILKVFDFFCSFLDEYHLRYVACGGTVLGAVRHKGFIPWDDDIDVYMSRKDYEKLLSLRSEVKKRGYDIISESDEGYYLPYAKIVDLNTTLWEDEKLPFVMGIFIDIFPLDQFEMSPQDITNIQLTGASLFRRYARSLEKYSISQLAKDFFSLRLRHFKYKLEAVLLARKSKILYKNFIDFKSSYCNGNGRYCVAVTQWEGKIFKTEWFEDVIKLPFEETFVIVPRKYDEYLSLLYGDYMTPPPMEKRFSQHFHYFVDLNKRFEINDIKEIKKHAK